MFGQYLLPILTPLWKALRSISDGYGVTPLSFHILMTLTFLSAPTFMAVQMNGAGLAAFILHFAIWAIYCFPKQERATKDVIHLYSFCALSVFATAFGVAENYGMPVAFLFLSWMILSLTYTIKADGFRLVGGFEIGLVSAAILFAPLYTPAIAILFGMACLVSAGITFLIDLKKKG